MIALIFPINDEDRYALLEQITIAAADDQTAGSFYIYQEFLRQLHTFLPPYRAQLDDLRRLQAQYHHAVYLQNQAFGRLKQYVRDFRLVLTRQIKREGLQEAVLVYYKLPANGRALSRGGIAQWLTRAEDIVEGEANVLAAGYPPTTNPSVADVEREWRDLARKYKQALNANRALDDLQNQLAEPRQEADQFIRSASHQLNTALYKLPADDVRHIKRRYGFVYAGGEEEA